MNPFSLYNMHRHVGFSTTTPTENFAESHQNSNRLNTHKSHTQKIACVNGLFSI